MYGNHVRFHVGPAREPFRAHWTLEPGRRTAFVDHVPAQQFFPVDALVETTATVGTDRRVRRRAPFQQFAAARLACIHTRGTHR